MQLSKNFWLSEFTKSDTASRHNINNIPTEEDVQRLQLVAQNILQPVRDHFQRPVVITSGFRCLELNRLLKSADTSQHIIGEAADFEVFGHSTLEVAQWISNNLKYDQLIVEMYNPFEGINSGWVHCSFTTRYQNRHEDLTYIRRPGTAGLMLTGFHSDRELMEYYSTA